MPIRVKLDEHLPTEFKRLFAEAGHDAETVLDDGLGGAQGRGGGCRVRQ